MKLNEELLSKDVNISNNTKEINDSLSIVKLTKNVDFNQNISMNMIINQIYQSVIIGFLMGTSHFLIFNFFKKKFN